MYDNQRFTVDLAEDPILVEDARYVGGQRAIGQNGEEFLLVERLPGEVCRFGSAAAHAL